MRGESGDSQTACRAALFATDAKSLLKSETLQAEVFGASSLIVRCSDTAEMQTVAGNIEGQLTATVHADESDYDDAGELLPLLELKAGRILFDGWPTGVEVCHAMVHGGPYPATVGFAQHLGRCPRDRTLPAARLLPERAEIVAAQRNR